jgi:hypothetical protein
MPTPMTRWTRAVADIRWTSSLSGVHARFAVRCGAVGSSDTTRRSPGSEPHAGSRGSARSTNTGLAAPADQLTRRVENLGKGRLN